MGGGEKLSPPRSVDIQTRSVETRAGDSDTTHGCSGTGRRKWWKEAKSLRQTVSQVCYCLIDIKVQNSNNNNRLFFHQRFQEYLSTGIWISGKFTIRVILDSECKYSKSWRKRQLFFSSCLSPQYPGIWKVPTTSATFSSERVFFPKSCVNNKTCDGKEAKWAESQVWCVRFSAS